MGPVCMWPGVASGIASQHAASFPTRRRTQAHAPYGAFEHNARPERLVRGCFERATLPCARMAPLQLTCALCSVLCAMLCACIRCNSNPAKPL
eukprot:356157-Chlamydomonas_euryale.AAC.5